jgi:hypothetical protein
VIFEEIENVNRPKVTTDRVVFLAHSSMTGFVASRSGMKKAPIPVAARFKACVCGRSLAGIAGSNAAGDMDVFLLCFLCVVRQRPLRRADQSSRVLSSVVPECDREASVMRRP